MDSRKRIFVSLTMFLVILAAGVGGFKILGGPEWSLLDSLYMTVITVSTIGYGEIHDLSGNLPARVFAVVFILASLGTIAFAVTSITAFVVEGELKKILGRRKMEKEIAKLNGHYIVCGGDETAQTIIRELVQTKRDFVVVEPARERIDRLLGLHSFLFVEGDPAEDSVLVRAGIERASGILLSLPGDEANLYVTVTARGLNPRIRIVAKGIELRSHAKLKRAGADYVVSPTDIGGMRMVSLPDGPAGGGHVPGYDAQGQGTGPPGRGARRGRGIGPGREDGRRIDDPAENARAPRRPEKGRDGSLRIQPRGRCGNPGKRRPHLHRFARKFG